jgi:hypothetical protein
MSIEQKIAEVLAESKARQLEEAKFAGKEGGSNNTKPNGVNGDRQPIRSAQNTVPNGGETPNPDNERNNNQNQTAAEAGTSKVSNPANSSAVSGDQTPVRKGALSVPGKTFTKTTDYDGTDEYLKGVGKTKGMKEDLDAMFGVEELSEEFKEKAATIFEAAVMSRVTEEVARLEEEFKALVNITVAEEIEGIVEQVNGYLGYIAEQWMTDNEIALERGIKSDILESFVDGLKGLFEEHYIDAPEEKYDLIGEMQETISELQSVIDEQVEVNVKLTQTVNEAVRNEIVNELSEGLTDTQAEKFSALVEEVAYDNIESFETKIKTLRESYFTNKTTSGVSSVVTDSPVELITEAGSKNVDPKMSAYLSALNNK